MSTRWGDIAVTARHRHCLFLWRDKWIPPVVPLSCLAHKMIQSFAVCKSFSGILVSARGDEAGVALAGSGQ